MAYQGIGTGVSPNDGTGDSLLDGAIKVNENFLEIYSAIGDGSTLNFSSDDFTSTCNINLRVVGNLSVSGITTLGNAAEDTTTVNGSLTVTGDTELGNTDLDTTTVKGTLTATRKLTVGSGIDTSTVNGDLNVTRNATLGTNSTNNTTVNGNLSVGSTVTATTFIGAGTIPIGGIVMWSGTLLNIPSGWSLCNGSNGTPDLRDRFLVCAGTSYEPGATGGANSVTLTVNEMPAHSHTGSTSGAGAHSHTGSTNGAGAHSHSTNFSSVVTQPGGNETPGGGGRGQYQNISINGVGDHAHSFTTSGVGDHTHSVSIGNAGGGGGHENRPPYYALAFIMRIS